MLARYTWPTLITVTIALFYAGCALDAETELDEADIIGVAEQEITFDADLGTLIGSPVAQGNTCNQGNQFNSSCGSNGSADLAYYWTAPYAGNFTFTTAGSSYDTVLQVLNDTQSASLGCNDDSNGNAQSTISLGLAAGQKITLVVDGYGAACGSFKLNISGAPAANSPPTTGLKMWLRADQGVVLSNGQVSKWLDQSGNGIHGEMLNAARQPLLVGNALNGRPVVRFNGAQSLYLVSPVQPTSFTVFVVGKNRKMSESFSMILGPGGNYANNQLRWENGSQVLFVGTGNNMPAVTSSIGDTRVFHLLSARYDDSASSMSVHRNGNFVSSHAFKTSGPWTLAQVGGWYSSYFMEGDLAEVLVYDQALSPVNQTSAEAYLESKYGL
jgi:hypothetical protein